MKHHAIGALNGNWRNRWNDPDTASTGIILPSHDLDEWRILEHRKYVQQTGRGKEQLAKLEREYVATSGLLKFVKLFGWFFENTPEV